MAKSKANARPRRSISLGSAALDILSPKASESVSFIDGFSVSVNGLIVIGSPPFKQWEEAATALRITEKGIQFAIGDLILQAEARLGEEASQLIDATQWNFKTVSVYRWLSSKVAPDVRRMDRLGIRHHLIVAVLTPAQQRKWLTKAANDDEPEPWTVKQLRDALIGSDDAPPAGWWILVSATDERDQTALQVALEAQGRTCKAVVRRQKK